MDVLELYNLKIQLKLLFLFEKNTNQNNVFQLLKLDSESILIVSESIFIASILFTQIKNINDLKLKASGSYVNAFKVIQIYFC